MTDPRIEEIRKRWLVDLATGGGMYQPHVLRTIGTRDVAYLLDATTGLEEQLEVLRKQIRDEDAEAATWEDHAQQWRKQYLAARQEAERLREALEEIASAKYGRDTIISMARAALAGPPRTIPDGQAEEILNSQSPHEYSPERIQP